jgi:hypothetical protein
MWVNIGMGSALLAAVMNKQSRLIDLRFLKFLLSCHLVENVKFYKYFINKAVINHAMQGKLNGNESIKSKLLYR